MQAAGSGCAQDKSQPITFYDSECIICGRATKQTLPDTPEQRGICYECFSEIWGAQLSRDRCLARKKAA